MIYSRNLSLLVEKIAEQICHQLHDYHSFRGFKFDTKRVLAWVSQFNTSDQLFILEEFLHILKQGTYVSEELGKKLLVARIKELTKTFGYAKGSDFLKDVEFLRLQPPKKSQSVLLGILDSLLKEKCGIGIDECGTNSKKYSIYIDDILATGKTVIDNLYPWLLQKNSSGKTNYQDIISKKKFLIVSVFCLHTWAKVDWILKSRVKDDGMLNKIMYRADYKVENNPTWVNQRLNCVYPIGGQPQEVMDFLKKLPEGREYDMTKMDLAFRKANKPIRETLFSSEKNRIRFENILLLKGIEILNGVVDLNENQRPLGNINPSFQTLGLGTLFFSWRNISNTTPVVFWWKTQGHPWFPLFPLNERGN